MNDYARDMADVTDWPDFPLMNVATAPLRAATGADKTGDAMSLWAGQAVGLARAETTVQVVERLIVEAQTILRT